MYYKSIKGLKEKNLITDDDIIIICSKTPPNNFIANLSIIIVSTLLFFIGIGMLLNFNNFLVGLIINWIGLIGWVVFLINWWTLITYYKKAKHYIVVANAKAICLYDVEKKSGMLYGSSSCFAKEQGTIVSVAISFGHANISIEAKHAKIKLFSKYKFLKHDQKEEMIRFKELAKSISMPYYN